MNKFLAFLAILVASSGSVLAGCPVPTPGPTLGAIGGPWGLVIAMAGYGTYRHFKGKSKTDAWSCRARLPGLPNTFAS